MNQLAPLRSRLATLRLARSAVRWGCALSHLALALLAGWAIAYLLDRTLLLSLPGRIVVLLAWAAAVGWFVARHVWPEWKRVETLEDIALHVEHRQRIDSDLIAALQFDAAGAGAWGSPRLSAAVVEYVADFAPSLNVFEGFSWRPLPSRLAVAMAAVAVAFLACATYPDVAVAFWNRFWLGSARYPTRTVIAQMEINGTSVPAFHSEPIALRIAQGELLHLQVDVEGELPREGTVDVRGLKTGSAATWRLMRPGLSEGPASPRQTSEVFPDQEARPSESPGLTYHLQPQSLVESVRLRVRLGDAVADPIEIALVPLPIIELNWTVTPPSYAPSADDLVIPDGARQFAVLSGSGLSLQLECFNKRLKSARFVLAQGEFSLSGQRSGDRALWTVPSGTPLDNITEPLSYELAVVDEDGLSPQPRIYGQIRLRPDRPPRVASTVVSKKVLPTAKPRISYGAMDDFGVTRVIMTIEITAVEGESRREERIVWTRPASASGQTTVRGETILDLSPLGLTKGDRLQMVLEAEDDRGSAPSQRGAGEPLTLEVTDRGGILSGLLETDQQSAKQLDAIILRELGIGGGNK